ncbi:MAG TPA: hypothetical protein VM680_14990 [Verrucomicrobiae bacterium]|nr:hypothetical protein [Verrucomicrobiae bacterium]
MVAAERAHDAKTLKEIIVAIGHGRGFQFVIKTLRPSRRITLLCVLLLIAVVAFLQRKDSTEPIEPVTLLTEPFKIPATPRDRFSMTLGPQKKWVSRAEHAIFGERKAVLVSAEIMQLSGPALTNLEATLKLPAPTYATNGLKIWFLSAAPLKKIREGDLPARGIEIMTIPHIQTADGITASMFMGQSMPTKDGMVPVGFGMKSAALVHDESIVLLTEIVQSEFGDGVVQTNFAINAQLNVPNGKGIFLVQQPKGAATNGWGVVIHPLR